MKIRVPPLAVLRPGSKFEPAAPAWVEDPPYGSVVVATIFTLLLGAMALDAALSENPESAAGTVDLSAARRVDPATLREERVHFHCGTKSCDYLHYGAKRQ
jgi:hypothetical protein